MKVQYDLGAMKSLISSLQNATPSDLKLGDFVNLINFLSSGEVIGQPEEQKVGNKE